VTEAPKQLPELPDLPDLPELPERDYRPIHPEPGWRSLARRIWGPLVVAAGLVAKFGFAGVKFFSIFIAVGGYALIWGWPFAFGFVLLILVHELGHYVEARRRGFEPALPVFVPFLGAYVAIRGTRMNPWQSAWVALAGPIAGSLGALATWIAADAYDSRFLYALAYTGFLINLFNLLPLGFLDGGHISRAISVMRRGGTPTKATIVGAAYVGLAVLLVLAMIATHVAQSRL
jgi:Zn-dependent protease